MAPAVPPRRTKRAPNWRSRKGRRAGCTFEQLVHNILVPSRVIWLRNMARVADGVYELVPVVTVRILRVGLASCRAPRRSGYVTRLGNDEHRPKSSSLPSACHDRPSRQQGCRPPDQHHERQGRREQTVVRVKGKRAGRRP